jgi:Ca-activated chloride channel family protein
MTLNVQPDRSLIRDAGGSVRYALLTFTAPEAPRAGVRPALNVAFVLDRSGSMGGSKIELARTAIVQALRMLRDTDRFAVIDYDNEVDVVVPSTAATAEAIRNAVGQVQGIQARGNTNLSGGWLRGCEQIASRLVDGETTRCLVLSDGLANEGITDREALAQHAAALRARGITTSCLGIGDDYDERLLSGIATAGRGHMYHVETAVQIPDFLHSELGEALETVARDVTITLRVDPAAAPGVTLTTLNEYPVGTNADGSISLQLGDLVSRQDVTLVFRLAFPAGRSGATVAAVFSIGEATGVLQERERDIIFTFAGHAQNDAQPRNRVVDRVVAELYSARARAEALELNRAGRYDDALARLEQTVRRIEQYAGSDPELHQIAEQLQGRHEDFASAMAPMAMKREFSSSHSSSRMRDVFGRAKRRPTT